jgi:tetratricopeptide (TPR) repeat protein
MVHPKPEELVQWLRRLCTSDRSTLGHLLECPACRAQALEELRRQDTEAGLADVLSYRRPAAAGTAGEVDGEEPEAYRKLTASFARITRRALACAEQEQQRASVLADELLAHPAPRREVLVANSERFRSLAIAQRVLEASQATGFEDPHEAEHLARLALAVIESVDTAFYGQRLIDDLRARAWSHVGNALRIANRTDEADAAFRRGTVYLQGTADPMEEAGFQHLLSSLRKQQRRFDEAADLLRSAARLFEEVGDTDRLARVLTGLGSSYLDQGSPEAAVEPLLEALRHVDALVDPRTALYIHHNLTVCLAETDRFLEAQRMFASARPLYDRFADRRTQLQRQWLEGILAAGTGRAERAEELFRLVQAAFIEAGMPLDAAVAGLDLAALYAKQGRTRDLKALSQELTEVLFSGRLHREALSALAYFVQAAQRERATLDVVQQVASFLRWADPGAPFQPAG